MTRALPRVLLHCDTWITLCSNILCHVSHFMILCPIVSHHILCSTAMFWHVLHSVVLCHMFFCYHLTILYTTHSTFCIVVEVVLKVITSSVHWRSPTIVFSPLVSIFPYHHVCLEGGRGVCGRRVRQSGTYVNQISGYTPEEDVHCTSLSHDLLCFPLTWQWDSYLTLLLYRAHMYLWLSPRRGLWGLFPLHQGNLPCYITS